MSKGKIVKNALRACADPRWAKLIYNKKEFGDFRKPDGFEPSCVLTFIDGSQLEFGTDYEEAFEGFDPHPKYKGEFCIEHGTAAQRERSGVTLARHFVLQVVEEGEIPSVILEFAERTAKKTRFYRVVIEPQWTKATILPKLARLEMEVLLLPDYPPAALNLIFIMIKLPKGDEILFYSGTGLGGWFLFADDLLCEPEQLSQLKWESHKFSKDEAKRILQGIENELADSF